MEEMSVAIETKCEYPKFLSVDFVDASMIKSQWQSHFLQVFPIEFSNLPSTHESDKECFEKNWKGDSYTTYEQFMEEYYKAYL